MTCRGFCSDYKASFNNKVGDRYMMGQKYCGECTTWINWDGLRCPCCKYKLRLQPRNRKYRNKAKKVVWIDDNTTPLPVPKIQTQ